jgi:hypothetical protein
VREEDLPGLQAERFRVLGLLTFWASERSFFEHFFCFRVSNRTQALNLESQTIYDGALSIDNRHAFSSKRFSHRKVLGMGIYGNLITGIRP